MMIYDSTKDIHVVIRTLHRTLIDTVACEVEVEDHWGRFTLRGGDAALAALVPSTIVVRRRDGSEAHLAVTWGSVTAAGNQVRVLVHGVHSRALRSDTGNMHELEPLPIAV